MYDYKAAEWITNAIKSGELQIDSPYSEENLQDHGQTEPLKMEKTILKVVEFYKQREMDRLNKMTELVTSKLEEELRNKQILARVSSRVKSAASLKAKLQDWSMRPEKAKNLNGTETDILRRVNDLAAARVMTYTEQDRIKVVEVAQNLFKSPERFDTPFDLELKENTEPIKSKPRNHYRATHMMLGIKNSDLVGRYENLPNDLCELQITSFLAHVWNEIEHDTVYKKLSGELSEEELDAIDSLGHLTKTGDNIITSLIRAREFREDKEHYELSEENKRLKNVEELVTFMSKYYGDKINNNRINFSNGAREFLKALTAINWHHPSDIVAVFSPTFLSEARKETLRLIRFLDRNGLRRPMIDVDTLDMFTVGLCMKRLTKLETALSDLHGSDRTKSIMNAFKDMGV